MRRTHSSSKFKPVFLILLGIFFAGLIFLAIKINGFYRGIYTANGGINQPTIPKEKTEFNILLLGYGGGQHEGTYLTDSMMILHLDLKKHKAAVISIPRDIWVKVPTESGDDFHIKINAIYQMGLYPNDFPDVAKKYRGDGKLIKYVMEQVTGLDMDNYMAVDFDGFKKAIDIIGGIDVNVAKTFDDYSYPIDGKENDLCGKEEQFKEVEKLLNGPTLTPDEQTEMDKKFAEKPELKEFFDNIVNDPAVAFPCRYEHLHFEAGKQHMNGETALKYVRSRHALQDGGDFGRASRQQKFLSAVKDKVISITFIPKIIPLLDEMKEHITTDIPVDQIKKFIGEAPNAGNYKITNFVLSNENFLKDGHSEGGQYILMPEEGIDEWDSVKTGIKNTIEGITPTPTPNSTITVTPVKKK